jgi:hypothetical protein
MSDFLHNNITPILLSALLALFGYMTHAVITNQANIQALSDDVDEVNVTLSKVLELMISNKNNK